MWYQTERTILEGAARAFSSLCTPSNRKFEMKAIRVGVCLLVAFLVLSFGGVEPWGAATLEIGAAVLFLVWGISVLRRRQAAIHWNWLYLPLLELCLFAIAQCVLRISVYPYLTRVEVLKWVALRRRAMTRSSVWGPVGTLLSIMVPFCSPCLRAGPVGDGAPKGTILELFWRN